MPAISRQRFFRYAGATLVTAIMTIGAALSTTPPTHAAPDDGKTVATLGHIDAPKTYWEGGTFVLKNEAHGKVYPLEQTVNWVGKGYNDTTQAQQFIYHVPDDPEVRFLRDTSATWYMAPQLPGWNQAPIWAGFGADADIPIEQFAGRTFTLDLVDFDGPGRMELMNYTTLGPLKILTRLISSHNPDLRSTWLTAGSHTHNMTLFSKPGRYTATYRVTARSADGTLIASRKYPHVWQVGGSQPGSTPSASLSDQFAAASDAPPQAGAYSLTVRPHHGRDNDGDDQLTDLVASVPEGASGTVTFLIDGYFLAEVPVKDGRATWPEMLGNTTSSLQAVFIPADGTHARWVSPEVSYSTGDAAATVSSPASAQGLPQPASHDPAPAFSTDAYTPTDLGFTLTLTPEDGGTFSTTIRFNDPKIRATIRGGYYEAGANNPTCGLEPSEMVSGSKGAATASITYMQSDCDGMSLRFTVLPHALIGALPTEVAIPTPVNTAQPLTYSGTLTAASPAAPADPDSNPSDATGTDGKPGGSETGTDPGSNPGAKPGTAPGTDSDSPHTQADPRLILNDGHVDIQARLEANGRLGIALKDDTRQHAHSSQVRELSSVAFALDDNTRRSTPRTPSGAANGPNFLPTPPAKYYLLDQEQRQGALWPGWSTTEVDAERAESLTLHLEPRSIPKGASYHVFTLGTFGETTELINSTRELTSITMPANIHAHAAWAFTQPGVYLLDASYSGTIDGAPASSGKQCLTVLVGHQAILDHRSGKTPSCADTPTAGTPTPDTPAGGAPSSESQPTDSGKTKTDGADAGTTPQDAAGAQSTGEQHASASASGAPLASVTPLGTQRLASSGAHGGMVAGALILAALGCACVARHPRCS